MNKAAWISPHKVLQLLLINTVYHLLVNNNKGEGGKLINYLLRKRGGLIWEGGGLIEDLRYTCIIKKNKRIFSAWHWQKNNNIQPGPENNILITRRVYRSRTYLSITPCATSSKTSSCLQSWSKTLLNLNVQKTIYIKLFHYFYYKSIHNIVTWS